MKAHAFDSKQSYEVVKRLKLFMKRLPRLKAGAGYLSKIDGTEKLSIGTWIEKNAAERPYHPALLYENLIFTYKEFNERVNRLANYWISQGLNKGDVVAIFMENRPEILFCVGAVVKIGAVAALINATQRKKVLLHSLQLCAPSLVVVGEELTPAYDEIAAEFLKTKALRSYFVHDKGQHPLTENYLDLEQASKESLITDPPSTGLVQLSDPCFYVYTSGTTGMPKASIMTHMRWIKAGGGMGTFILSLEPSDVLYVTLPFYHNNALTVSWGAVLSTGATMAMRRKFSASQFWEDTRKFHATAFCYIGELCRYLMNQPPRDNDRDNPIRKITGNGMRPDIWKEFKQRFDIPEVYEFYAASEANIGFINLLNLDCTVGFCPASYAIVKYDLDQDVPILNKKGKYQHVKTGEVGLLLGEVTEKYRYDGYTDKTASEKKLLRNVFKDGDVWFNSGDLLRDQGFRHAQFVDRLGDTFRWKGENVSTTEVEEVINQFAAISEATVYGVELPGADGRVGMMSIVSKQVPVDFDFTELYGFLAKNLSNYAIPVFLRFQTELDITGTFKHKKVELKAQGFDLNLVKDPIFVLLPKTITYVRLNKTFAKQIAQKEISF